MLKKNSSIYLINFELISLFPGISQIICSTILPLYIIWGSLILMLKTKRQASVMSESMKALIAEACLHPTYFLASSKAALCKVLGEKEEMKNIHWNA